MHIDKSQRQKLNNKSRDVVFIVMTSTKVDDGSDDSKSQETYSKPENKRSSRPVGAHERVQTRQMTQDLVANRTRSKLSLCAMIALAQTMMVEKIPETVDEAKKSPNAEQWKMAIAEEIASFKNNQTWELVELLRDRRAIKNKWVFRVKMKPDGSADRFKTRLVVKGARRNRASTIRKHSRLSLDSSQFSSALSVSGKELCHPSV